MKKNNWLVLFLACAVTLTAFNSCKKSEDDAVDSGDTGPTEWTTSTVFGGSARSYAASFQIGNAGYIVGGMVGSAIVTPSRRSDAWVFNNGSWTQIAEFPGGARDRAVGFAINGKGYVGAGYNGTTALKDFYEFDPATGQWEEIAELPGPVRYGAVAFTLGNAGYVGLGNTGGEELSDFYRYNPATDSWSIVETNFTSKRSNSFAFVIGNKAYVGGGFNSGGNAFPNDFYSFDGTNWTRLNPISTADYNLTRQSAAAFTIGNYGYVVGGRQSSVLGNVWKYDPATDSWTDKHQALTTAGASSREGAVAFSIDGSGYVTTGITSNNRLDDNWKFTPVR